MKNSLGILTIALLLIFAACKKKDVSLGSLPRISLKTGTGYLAANDTVTAGDTIKIGINADTDGNRDKLTSLVIRRSINYAEYITVKDVKVPADQNEKFSYDLPLIVQTLGSQSYKFVIVNAHGLENEVLINFRVQP